MEMVLFLVHYYKSLDLHNARVCHFLNKDT